MRYTPPDYEKIMLASRHHFASYAQGCPQNEGGLMMYTSPCVGTSDYREVNGTFTGLGLGNACYTTYNP